MLDLPPLNLRPPTSCPICRADRPPSIGERDFGDSCNDAFTGTRTFPNYGVAIPYHRCDTCGFIFTAAFDGWSDDDYRSNIYNDEYIRSDPPFLHERPLRNALVVAGIWHHDKEGLCVLDYGAGNGSFAAELAKLGVECDSCDLFYGQKPPHRRYPVVTCFDVIEHIPHGQQFAAFAELTSHVEPNGVILLSTLLLNHGSPVEHYYVSPRNGHVSVHSPDSLRRLAANCDFAVTSLNSETHVLRRPARPDAVHIVEFRGGSPKVDIR